MEAVLTPPRAAPVDSGLPPHEREVRSEPPTPSRLSAGDDNPLDWANENLDPREGLASIGWQYAHSKGQDQFWVRPGKNMRDGHSAVIHDDGTVVIWTTDLPPGWDRLGKQGVDGSVVMTPFDVFCAVTVRLRREGGDAAHPSGTDASASGGRGHRQFGSHVHGRHRTG